MYGVLVTVVSTVVVAITQPVRLHTDVGLLTFEVLGGTGGVAATALVSLVRRHIVLTVIHTIAHLQNPA